jgi:hypothetical protein
VLQEFAFWWFGATSSYSAIVLVLLFKRLRRR